MEVIGNEQQLCSCYNKYQVFHKLVELKDSGLVVYCHRARTNITTPDEAAESAIKTSRDVFILHNKKDARITTSQLTSELEKKKICCPRCRKIFKHAQELVQELKLIDRKIVIGICDHCRKRAHCSNKPFCTCDKIVKLFKSIKVEQTEDAKKYVKEPSKIEHFRKDKQKQREISTYSDLQINQILNSTVARHEPEVQQMFCTDAYFDSNDIEMSKSDSKVSYMKQSVTFVLPNKQKGEIINTKGPGISLVDPDITSVETYIGVRELPSPCIKNRQEEDIFEDSPSVDAKEELKRRHDISLRQMMRFDKDSKVPLSVSKRPNVYEIPKRAPWEQQNEISKGHKVDKEKKPVLHVAKSKSVPITSVGKVLKPHFSFLFLKKKEKKENQANLEVSSAILIKDTQEKFHLQSEVLKKRKETERLQKFESEQKKKLAREEKKLQEKKRQALEEKKKYVEEQRRLAEMDKFREAESEVSKKDIKSESEQIEGVSKKSEMKFGGKSKPEEKDKGVEKEEKLKTEGAEKLKTEGEEKLKTERPEKLKTEREEKLKTERAEKLKTEREEKLKTEGKKEVKTEEEKNLKTEVDKEETNKIKKGESDGKVQRNKQEKEKSTPPNILRDRNQQLGNQKLKQKEPSRTDKAAFSKARQSTKIKRDSSNHIEMSLSNIDKSIGKQNRNITGKKKVSKISKGESEVRKDIKQFQKLQAQHLKEKEEALQNKQKLKLEAQKAKQEAERKVNIKIRMKQARSDSHLLKRVKIKQAKKIRPSDIDPELLKAHKLNHYKSGQQSPVCPVCLDSELELDVLSLDYKTNLKKDKITDIIIGEKIYKKTPFLLEKTKKPKELKVVPIFLQKDFKIESDEQPEQNVQIIKQTEPVKKKTLGTVSKNNGEQIEMEKGKGIMRYALSDRTFIAKGWTKLPTEKVVRRMHVYRMHPAHPEFDWFEHNKNKRLMTYDTGERLAEFDDNGRGRWYYRNGRLALDYYDAEETNAQQRFVIYSSGEPDERGRTHPITVLATFDYLGNGIVLDHAGKIRLKYNQTEGVLLDRTIGPVSHWKWHTLNDPPVLQQVMIDTQMLNKDPDILKLGSSENLRIRPDNEEMLAIEFDNFIKDKNKKLSQKFKPFQIKMKALKINEHFSLKVLDQATVYLIFRDGLTNLKVNIGMILDDTEIVDTVTSIVGEVSTSLERFPARTDSLAGLQRSMAHAQRYERQHAERERRLRPPEPCASVDLLNAAVSSPMRLPLKAVSTGSSTNTGCSSTKPSNSLYYDPRHY